MLPMWSQSTYTAFRSLWITSPQSSTEILTFQRQQRTIELGIHAVNLLGEPFQNASDFEYLADIILSLHFCARIIDDALDEGMPLHTKQSCAIQPFFFHQGMKLEKQFPVYSEKIQALIQRWFQSIQQGDHDNIEQLHQRCEHLHLFDLCFNSHQNKSVLENALWWMQVIEELHSDLPSTRKCEINRLFEYRLTKLNTLLDRLNELNYKRLSLQIINNVKGSL